MTSSTPLFATDWAATWLQHNGQPLRINISGGYRYSPVLWLTPPCFPRLPLLLVSLLSQCFLRLLAASQPPPPSPQRPNPNPAHPHDSSAYPGSPPILLVPPLGVVTRRSTLCCTPTPPSRSASSSSTVRPHPHSARHHPLPQYPHPHPYHPPPRRRPPSQHSQYPNYIVPLDAAPHRTHLMALLDIGNRRPGSRCTQDDRPFGDNG
ncbi:hypothetical protein B0H10DRAFT_374340 [Mycena sp. CBHHK59/15]|nr:hypothetical protein B0H10DRAFT_374340 [Mycena sp. CBHHK59/15]